MGVRFAGEMGVETDIWGREKATKGPREQILFREKVKAPVWLQRSKERNLER